MGLPRTVSEINGDFGRKPLIFSTPVNLSPPLKEFSLELGTGARFQKLHRCGYRAEKEV